MNKVILLLIFSILTTTSMAQKKIDHCAGKNLNSCFTFLLIPATAGYADKHLSATLSCMVDVPVVTAAWFKGDIGNACLFTRDRGEVTVTSEILCISGVWFSDRKNHFALERCFFIFIFTRDIFIPYFFGKTECRPCFRPSCIEADVSDDLCNFRTRNTVVFG